jgi:hypothetical protein
MNKVFIATLLIIEHVTFPLLFGDNLWTPDAKNCKISPETHLGVKGAAYLDLVPRIASRHRPNIRSPGLSLAVRFAQKLKLLANVK